jgi:hypothetical protein
MNLTIQPNSEQVCRGPKSGRHVLAQYDCETIIVYQAYRSEIGNYTVSHDRFCGSGKALSGWKQKI